MLDLMVKDEVFRGEASVLLLALYIEFKGAFQMNIQH